MILAFFPCVRFEAQIIMNMQGNASGMKNWKTEKKLAYSLKLNNELCEMYGLVTMLAIICLKKNLKLIIENPYSTQHYLTRYWCIKPKIIDVDRSWRGDYYKKPTQYFFINCEPKNNLLLEGRYIKAELKKISNERTVERSMISPYYANRFIREYLI